MLERMRYALYPVAISMMFAVSALWQAPLKADPVEPEPQLAQAERRDRRPGPERMRERAEQRFEELCKHLELSDEQKTKARECFEAHQETSMKVFEAIRDGNLERGAIRDSMAVLRKAYRDKVNTLLTEEQKAKYKEWDDRPRRRGGRRPGGAFLGGESSGRKG
jgi:Spy/CpxP family protein refolding chaperone